MTAKQFLAAAFLAMTTITGMAADNTPAAGDTLKQFTLEDLNFGGVNARKFYPENRWTTWWGDKLVRLDAESCFFVDTQTGREKVFLRDADLKKAGLRVPSFYSASFPDASKTIALLRTADNLVAWDWKARRTLWTLPLEKGTQASDFCYASRTMAYVKDNQLYVSTVGDKTMTSARRLTTDGSRNIVYGQSVHRDEFGINGGLFFSPNGKRLAFYRMDQSMVTDYPQVDIPDPEVVPDSGSRIATPAPDKYPMAGETSHKVTVGVYDIATGKTLYLKAGDPTDRYFTNIAWSPDSKTIYMFELNRDQNHAVLCQYDATTGKLTGKLLEETHPKYVEPQHPIVFLPWDNSKFIYQSQRDGYNHLYLCDITTSLKGDWKSEAAGGKHIEYIPVKQLTEGKWLVGDILGFNAKRKEVIFQAVDGKGCNNFAVNVNTGKRSLPFSFRSTTEGEHNGTLSASGTYLIDRYSTPTLPRCIDIVDTKSLKTVNLLTAPNPYEGYQMPTIETGTIKAADGTTDLYYRLTKPSDFDPNKKYPVIVYVYGGPHAQLVTGGWLNGSRGWDIYMANKGYIMFTLDNRGSANRGLEFENATFRRLGIEEGRNSSAQQHSG